MDNPNCPIHEQDIETVPHDIWSYISQLRMFGDNVFQLVVNPFELSHEIEPPLIGNPKLRSAGRGWELQLLPVPLIFTPTFPLCNFCFTFLFFWFFFWAKLGRFAV